MVAAYCDLILHVKSTLALHLLVQDIFWLFLLRSIVCAVRHKEDSSGNTFHSFHSASVWRTDLIWMAKSRGIISTADFWVPEAVWVTLSWDSRAFESCLWGRATWSLTITVLSNTTIKLHNACVWKYQTLRGLLSHTDKSCEWYRSSNSHSWIYFPHDWNRNNRFQISDLIPKAGCFNGFFQISLFYHSCLQQQRRTCQHESEKVSIQC